MGRRVTAIYNGGREDREQTDRYQDEPAAGETEEGETIEEDEAGWSRDGNGLR